VELGLGTRSMRWIWEGELHAHTVDG
jgi:hypothetical protein